MSTIEPRASLLGVKLWRIVLLAVAYSIPPLIYLFVVRMPHESEPPERLDPAAAASQYHQAEEALRKGEIEEAVTLLEELRAFEPYNALIHGTLGLAYQKAERFSEALAATRMALGLDPGLDEARYNLGAFLSRLGRMDEALKTMRPLAASRLDLRTLAEKDPDLAALREDIRFRIFLAGAETIPLHTRTAELRTGDSLLLPGQPFQLVLEVLSLEEREGIPDLTVSVADTHDMDAFTLEEARVRREVGHEGEHTYVRWTFSWTLNAARATMAEVGRWEVQIDGVQVPIKLPVLSVLPLGADMKRDALPSSRPALLASFFSHVLPSHVHSPSGPVLVERLGVSTSPYRCVALRIPEEDEERLRRIQVDFPEGLYPLESVFEHVELSDRGESYAEVVYVFRTADAALLRAQVTTVHLDGKVFQVKAVPPGGKRLLH